MRARPEGSEGDLSRAHSQLLARAGGPPLAAVTLRRLSSSSHAIPPSVFLGLSSSYRVKCSF